MKASFSSITPFTYFLIGVLGFISPPAEATPFNVLSYGAAADGTTDNSPAFNKAISASVAAGTNNEILIPTGTYRLSKSVEVKSAESLTIRGEAGTTLLMDDADTPIMLLNSCKNLVIKSLSFDRKRLSFTQGTITSVDPVGKNCEVMIDANYAAPDAPHLAKATLHPFVYPKSGTYQLDRYISEVVSWQELGAGHWRAKLKGHAPTAEWAGKRFFVWAAGKGHCFVGRDLEDCLFEDINYWGGGGNAGLYFFNLSGTMTFRRFVVGVPPGSDRMLSCGGGGQIGQIRGKLVFEDCEFTKIDDDGLDILGTWTRVLEQRDARTLVLQTDNDFRAGDHIALWDWQAKIARSEAVIVEVKANADRSRTVVFDRELKTVRVGAGEGPAFGSVARDDGIDRVINLDMVGTETTIRNCRFQVFRAKCLNLKARNCTVEGCTFSDSWQPAISAASEWYFEEGPPIRDLIIRNNHFLNCNHNNIEIGTPPGTGHDKPSGVPSPSRDSTHILIEGNSFAEYGAFPSVYQYWPIGNAIRVQNAKGVIIRNNKFGPPANSAPKLEKILIFDSDDVVQKDNGYGLPGTTCNLQPASDEAIRPILTKP